MINKIKLRDKIISVASELFHRQGYNSTGINQIIAESDIAYASLYNNFSSKDQLLIACLERQSADFFSGFDNFSKSVNDPKKKLFKLIDYRVKLQKPNFLGCPFTKIINEVGVGNQKVQQIVSQHKNKQKKQIHELLVQIRSNMSDMEIFSNCLFLMIEGATVNSTVDKDVKQIENVRSFLSQMLS